MPRFKKYKANEKISVDNFNQMLRYAESLANLKVVGGKFTINRGGATLEVSTSPNAKVYLVKLDEALAKGSLDNPTTARAKPYFVSALNENLPPTIALSDVWQITVVNRNDTFEASAQDNILVTRVDFGSRLEWQPIVGNNPEVIVDTNPTDCSCDNCISGVMALNAVECCEIPLFWTMENPWTKCETKVLRFEYLPDDKWITQTFSGPPGDSNEYRYIMEVSVTGNSYISLAIAQNNGTDIPCLIYGKLGFDCLCSNTFTLDKPLGKVIGIKRKDLTCTVCIVPTGNDIVPACAVNDAPRIIKVTLKDIAPGAPVVGWFPDDGEIFLVYQDENTVSPIDRDVGCGFYHNTPMNVWLAKYQTDTVNLAYGQDVDLLMKASCTGSSRFDIWIGIITDTLVDGNTPTTIFDISNYSRTDSGNALIPFDIRYGIPNLFLDSYCDPTSGTGESTIGRDVVSVEPLNPYQAVLNTGACEDADCLSDIAPAKPYTGYCCMQDFCMDFVSSAFCSQVGGTWHDNGDCPGDCGA